MLGYSYQQMFMLLFAIRCFFSFQHAIIITNRDGMGGVYMKSDAYTQQDQPEHQENDFLDLVVSTAVSTIVLMGIFVVVTVASLFV